MAKHALNITREQNFPEWYQEVVTKADLADNSIVRGCMVMKPYGYAIWENIHDILNKKIKECGVQNAYFPLLIPIELLQKEADHIAGFAKECAVVTHHRLKADENCNLQPDGKLEQPYVIRPTSETIIGESFSAWVHSYRDLPLKINQWANVMRWEMRTRMFLRTSEFLWQEGHNVFAAAKEAEEDSLKMLGVYKDLMENYLAMTGLDGQKTPDEKFPGAKNTYTIESIMQDGKALQSCTSHDLGQNFTKSSNIKFTDKDGQEKYAYSTSWGMSTRIIGGLIMSHSDDDGLVLPPRIAPYKAVIIPVIHDESKTKKVMTYCEKLKKALGDDRIFIDDSYESTPNKNWNWVRKGAPIRINIGEREIDENKVFFVRRDKVMEKREMSFDDFVKGFEAELDGLQNALFEKNKKMMIEKVVEAKSVDDVKKLLYKGGCFISIPADWYGDKKLEKVIGDASASYRCYPFEMKGKVIVGKSY